jgi:hypothetical protein
LTSLIFLLLTKCLHLLSLFVSFFFFLENLIFFLVELLRFGIFLGFS